MQVYYRNYFKMLDNLQIAGTITFKNFDDIFFRIAVL